MATEALFPQPSPRKLLAGDGRQASFNRERDIPDVGPADALIRITTTTICSTGIHIPKGEYPVAKRLTIGHEPVGAIEKPGAARPAASVVRPVPRVS